MTPSEKIEDKKQHRKLQNRANQRARRLRLRERGLDAKTVNQGQFEITRWRLLSGNSASSSRPPRATTSESKPSPGQGEEKTCQEQVSNLHGSDLVRCRPLRATREYTPSPGQDLLLNLIQYNVLRGIFDNKLAIIHLVTYFVSGGQLQFPFKPKDYPTRAAILPTRRQALPASLLPTQLQMTAEHPTWIDSIPFPRMRDNLILREGDYDHREFAQDLVGDLMNITRYYEPQSAIWSKHFSKSAPLPGDDELTTTRKGFIVWGEPYDPKSWEVTPGFISKWRWTLEGCDYLIDSSNHWRQSRGEDPLPESV